MFSTTAHPHTGAGPTDGLAQVRTPHPQMFTIGVKPPARCRVGGRGASPPGPDRVSPRPRRQDSGTRSCSLRQRRRLIFNHFFYSTTSAYLPYPSCHPEVFTWALAHLASDTVVLKGSGTDGLSGATILRLSLGTWLQGPGGTCDRLPPAVLSLGGEGTEMSRPAEMLLLLGQAAAQSQAEITSLAGCLLTTLTLCVPRWEKTKQQSHLQLTIPQKTIK